MSRAASLLCCRGLARRFGGLAACDGVDLDLFPGRVHALLGENGAGKSTLMSLISGRLAPDQGSMRLEGRAFAPASPAEAMRAGIGMVHQRFSLIEALSGAENLALAAGGAPSRAQAEELAARFGLPLDMGRRVAELSMGERQRLEILKLLARKARILILDEPTSVLAPAEIRGLYATLRRLADQGRAVVLITHKLPEVTSAADEVSVLRRGRMLARNLPRDPLLPEGWDMPGLARLMVGRELPEEEGPRAAGEAGEAGEPVLRVRGLAGQGEPPAFAGVDLDVARGEIVALVGVAGNGQEALAAVLGGLERAGAGSVRILGRKPERTLAAYVPEDRHGAATVPELTLAENFLLSTSWARGFLLRRNAGTRAARAALEALGAAASGPNALARELSGGNLQKFILARELSKNAPLLVVEQPTQGLDVLAVAELRQAIRAAAASAAVLLVTGDPEEALALASRVGVMYRGRILGWVAAAAPDALGRIGRLMAGLPEEGGGEAAA